MIRLAQRRTKTYEFIWAYYQEHKYGPTIREIAQHLESCGLGSKATGKVSENVAHNQVKHLAKHGLVAFTPGKARTLHPLV